MTSLLKEMIRILWWLTCLSPRCVNAEHSMYFTALILWANFWPASRFTGDWPWSERRASVSLSSRRSILVPGDIKRCQNIIQEAVRSCQTYAWQFLRETSRSIHKHQQYMSAVSTQCFYVSDKKYHSLFLIRLTYSDVSLTVPCLDFLLQLCEI